MTALAQEPGRTSLATQLVGFLKRYQGPIQYGIAATLLVGMMAMNWSGLKDLVSREPHVAPFLAAAAITVGCAATSFYRWYLLVRALDLPFTLRDAFRLGLVGLFYNSFLPGSVGGDLVKAYFIARGQPERKAAAVATVVADRLIGLFGLILFSGAVGGGCWLAGDARIAASPKLQLIVWVCVGLAAVAVVGYVALGLLPAARADRFAGRLAGVRKVGPTLAELWFTVRQYRRRPATILAAVALSACIHTGMVFIFDFAVHVFPPKYPELLGTLPEHFVVVPIAYIVQALIPVPGGIGGGEMTFGGLYKLIRGPEAVALGLTPEAAEAVGLAGRLTMRVIEWTIGLVGYLAYLRMKSELPAPEEVAKGEEVGAG